MKVSHFFFSLIHLPPSLRSFAPSLPPPLPLSRTLALNVSLSLCGRKEARNRVQMMSFLFFFFTTLGLELSDTKVYEP